MRILDRVLLAIYTILIIIISVIAMAIALRWIPADTVYMYIRSVYDNTQVAIAVLIVGLLFLVISLELLLSGSRRSTPRGAMLKSDGTGSVMLSVNAIDSMVQRSARMIEGIKDIKSSVSVDPEGTQIMLSVQVEQDVKIPELTDNLQSQVKEYVENYGGIKIKAITVRVDSISPTTRYKAE